MKKLVLASKNKGKLKEIRDLLHDLEIEIVDLDGYPEAPEISEEGETFLANALHKAKTIAVHTGEWTLADDSGLAVAALNGAPGVRSARYAGMHGDDAANNQKLLAELRDVPRDRRNAKFICALALVSPNGETVTAEGACEGRIGYGPKGENGFGYDPIFFIPALNRMMAELTPEQKGRISHRARALRQLRAAIMDRLTAASGS